MAARKLPPQSVLLQLLRYEPETGRLYWKERSPEWFKASNGRQHRTAAHTAKLWNSKNAGKEAFISWVAGYRKGAIFDVEHLAHRIIWMMINGHDPDQIDHINGDRSDNRIGNLRDVSETLNKRNSCLPSHNTSGVVGVSYDGSRQRWAAYITLDDRKISLGRHDTFEEAVAARKAAEAEHGFHENHGRAA